ncbi:nuclease (plasmid) [Novosphingobium sp. BL-8A]|uniref:nuclease n=1 Tax=Novosphingobium sp. BL-8A TaxID=3127639 RepID=UPI0037576E43
MPNNARNRLAASFLAACLMAMPSAAFAWGQQAHAAIDGAAIEALPADGPIFLKAQIDYVTGSATLPDKWRAASEPFAKIEEDPNHGWFREQFAFLSPIPRSRYAFVLALYRERQRIKESDPEAAARTNVRWTGTLPYAVMEQYENLVAQMRLLREARAKGRADQARFLEQSCAFTVVRLGHYIGDRSQPLHVSVNSDGWRGPNPAGFTRSGTVHSKFESRYVALIGLTPADAASRMRPIARQDGDLFSEILAFLEESGRHVEAVYQLDSRGALDNTGDTAARELVIDRTAAGAALLRDVIVRAWHQSATPPLDTPDPLDPANPDYDPDTGSAPAAFQLRR